MAPSLVGILWLKSPSTTVRASGSRQRRFVKASSQVTWSCHRDRLATARHVSSGPRDAHANHRQRRAGRCLSNALHEPAAREILRADGVNVRPRPPAPQQHLPATFLDGTAPIRAGIDDMSTHRENLFVPFGHAQDVAASILEDVLDGPASRAAGTWLGPHCVPSANSGASGALGAHSSRLPGAQPWFHWSTGPSPCRSPASTRPTLPKSPSLELLAAASRDGAALYSVIDAAGRHNPGSRAGACRGPAGRLACRHRSGRHHATRANPDGRVRCAQGAV